jgi:hypothetical protein
MNAQKRQYSHNLAQTIPPSKRQRTGGTQASKESMRQDQVQNAEHHTPSTQLPYDNNTGFQTYSDSSQNPWTQGQMYDHAQPCPNCPQDMFGHLSWESLIQNNDLSYDFWANEFPEI